MSVFEEATVIINCVEHGYLRKKFGVVYIRRHKVHATNTIIHLDYYLQLISTFS